MLYTYSLDIPSTGGERIVKVGVNGDSFELNLSFTDNKVLLKPVKAGSEVEVSYKSVGSEDWVDVISFTANPSPPSPFVTLVGSSGEVEIASDPPEEKVVTPVSEPVIAEEPPTNLIMAEAVASSSNDLSS